MILTSILINNNFSKVLVTRFLQHSYSIKVYYFFLTTFPNLKDYFNDLYFVHIVIEWFRIESGGSGGGVYFLLLPVSESYFENFLFFWRNHVNRKIRNTIRCVTFLCVIFFFLTRVTTIYVKSTGHWSMKDHTVNGSRKSRQTLLDPMLTT